MFFIQLQVYLGFEKKKKKKDADFNPFIGLGEMAIVKFFSGPSVSTGFFPKLTFYCSNGLTFIFFF